MTTRSVHVKGIFIIYIALVSFVHSCGSAAFQSSFVSASFSLLLFAPGFSRGVDNWPSFNSTLQRGFPPETSYPTALIILI